MIRSGAFDEIGPQGSLGFRRAVMLACLDEAIKVAEQHERNQDSGMGDLFGESVVAGVSSFDYQGYSKVRPLTEKERLNGEKETLGLYLTGHPIDEYESELQNMLLSRVSDLKPGKDNDTVAGMVVAMRLMKNKRGDNFAFLTLDDKSGRIELSLWAEKYAAYRDILGKDALLVVKGVVSEDNFTGGLKMVAESVQSIYEARCAKLSFIELHTKAGQADWVDKIQSMLSPYRDGNCAVIVRYTAGQASGQFKLGSAWRVQPKDELISNLRERLGKDNVVLNYD
jgi:DNA polymerase-3 subunit alpha